MNEELEALFKVPLKFIIPAGMLLKHMSEADWENMKAFIRGEGVADIVPEVEEELKCPFCGMEDFDKVGLKYHLEVYCQVYADVPDISEEL